MSVRVVDRKESSAQFLQTAQEILTHTIRYTNRRFNKKDQMIADKLRELALDLYTNVLFANSIYATTEDDLKLKREHFIKVRADCYTMSGLLSAIKAMSISKPPIIVLEITPHGWNEWAKLLTTEINLITGLLKTLK